MTENIGRGFFGSLRAHVRFEVNDLARRNKTLRQVRSGLLRRSLIAVVRGIRLYELIALYVSVDVICAAAEWWVTTKLPRLLPDWGTFDLHQFLKDADSYLIAGQVGILGIVAVAVGIVTLLSQRDDRSSATSDVRLYYSESLAYEVVTSGVALLVVLFVQLFWPLQFALRLIQGRGQDPTFELILTVLHALWMVANVLLFYQFMRTTLSFVEPDARIRMRDRYTADTALPRDIAKRLLQAFYMSAPQAIFGKETLSEGPSIQFGFGRYFVAQGATEIETRFAKPSRLADVRMRLLSVALGSWRRRVRNANKAAKPSPMGARKWDGEVIIPISFDSYLDGPTAWVLREGEVALSWWERQLVKRSFRFARAAKELSDPLTPNSFMEELTDKLVGQIEKSALSGFKTALAELVRYHSFILSTQDTIDSTGAPLNLAQIGAGLFERPDQSWIRLYRRVYFAAVDKIASEATFVDALGHVAQELIPADARNVSSAVVTTLLDVGIYEVVALEDWVTRRTTIETVVGSEAQHRLVLAGSDRRAYERVIINFVGAWESVLQMASIVYKWRESESFGMPEQWLAHTQAWPYLRTHLHSTAYFFALAVWNEDRVGAERYRDMLLRWLTPFYAVLRDIHVFRHPEFLTLDLFGVDYDRAGRIGQTFRSHSFYNITANALFGISLRAAHDDALILSAALVLSWAVKGTQSSDIGRREASAILQRQLIPGEGSTLTTGRSTSPFWASMAVLLRGSLDPLFAERTYSATLNELVRRLAGMTQRYVVPGRVYSSWGADGVDMLRPFLLAIMAAHFRTNEAERTSWLNWFVANDQIFKESDRSVRAVIYEMQTIAKLIEEGAQKNDFDDALSALDPSVDCVGRRAELKSFLDTVSERLANQRRERLRALPVDSARIDRIRDAIRTELLTHGPEIFPFQGFNIYRGVSVAAEARVHAFDGVDKGELVSPSMSDAPDDNRHSIAVQVQREYLAGDVWREFFKKERKSILFDISAPAADRWRVILSHASCVESKPTLLVPYEPLGEEISTWTYLRDRPQHFHVEHVADMPSGGGTGYIGTIDGVHVYEINGLSDRAILCSGRCLRSVTYQLLPDRNDLIDVSLEENDNPAECRFLMRTAQVLDWSNDPIIEFSWAAAPAIES
jgi:hypothetical protein